MPEVEPCALCGRELVTLGKDSYSRYGYSCCGITIWSKDPTTWNRVQAALRAEKELFELKKAAMPVVEWWRRDRFIGTPFCGVHYVLAHIKNGVVSTPVTPEHLNALERLCGGAEKGQSVHKYDPKFGDDRVCECGHQYHRHFDSYANMEPVGCKYCQCSEFKEADSAESLRISELEKENAFLRMEIESLCGGGECQG